MAVKRKRIPCLGRHGLRLDRGFTLIELLVVISIIGVLSTVAMTSLNAARAKARDAVRMTEINSLSLAVQSYFLSTGSYPTDSSASTGWSAAYLSQLTPYASVVPVDHTSSGSYYYRSRRVPASETGAAAFCRGHYVVYAYLEGTNNKVNTTCWSNHYYAVVLDEY